MKKRDGVLVVRPDSGDPPSVRRNCSPVKKKKKAKNLLGLGLVCPSLIILKDHRLMPY